MVPPLPVTLLIASFAAGAVLAAVVIRVARRFELVAVPNERSSHDSRTPTVGGIAIALPVLVLLGWAAASGDGLALALLVAAAGLALVGLIDDVWNLAAAPRFLCQILAVGLLLWQLSPETHWVGWLLIGFLMLWHVNLFNFMDGIDGIAGVQVLLFCVGVQLLAGGFDGLPGSLTWVISGATLGFLAFNWPPARLFMGDVGSLFLGLLIAVLVALLDQRQILTFIPSIIVLTGFWFDASYTLCVRMLTGQPFTRPHRSHLYQRVADRVGHRGTTLAFAGLGVVWLLPLAWLASRFETWGPLLLVAATLPYLAGAILLKAGRSQPPGAESAGVG